ncbi:unnamed protein product [Discosporangium mesarthrocarpum]
MEMSSGTSGGTQARPGNRLASETSPYLLQHAHNPVNWLPWGEEAFTKAKTENKPIFLSVGYSTCHWCHVMERESFESEVVAKILNEQFVPVKVDREERPDVDQVYMTFVQATTGGGGWPMSVWLTPDLKPFVGATYFPEERFVKVLETLAEKWVTERAEILSQGDKVINALQTRLLEQAAAAGDPESTLQMPKTREVVRQAVHVLDRGHDDQRGGWAGGRGGMKFPQPSRMNMLLRAWALEGPESDIGRRALEMTLTTLDAMARGGIYDHIAGGFARYSTDPRWHVPHFEKMIYDNAQLVVSYVEAYQVTHDPTYMAVARDVLKYAERDLKDPLGGFYSAQDADSYPFDGAREKKEGAFCVWTEPELRKILDTTGIMLPGEDGEVPVYQLFASVYGIAVEGNVDPSMDIHGELTSQNVLFKAHPVGNAVEMLKLQCSEQEATAAMDQVCAVLLEVRAKRPLPHLDDKVVTSWNGLMISALSKASRALAAPPESAMPGPAAGSSSSLKMSRGGHAAAPAPGGREESLHYLQVAEETAAFIHNNLYDHESRRLQRSWRGGRGSGVDGFADDYAFLIRGLLDLYEADPRLERGGRWLQWARELQAEMDDSFSCPPEKGGGYYSSRAGTPGSAASGVDLPLRLRTDYDGAEPGAASVAVGNVARLANYFSDPDLRLKAATQLVQTTAQEETPQALPELVGTLATTLLGPKQVIVSGTAGSPDTQALLAAAQSVFCPNICLMLNEVKDVSGMKAEEGEGEPSTPKLFEEVFKSYGGLEPSVGGAAAAYVCFNNVCSRPITGPEELFKVLSIN